MAEPELIGLVCPACYYEVETGKIAEYAEAIGDPNPVYYDEAAAKAAGLDRIVAPPTFAAVFSSRPMRELIKDRDYAKNQLGIDMARVLHAEQQYDFRREIQAGDRLTITGKITEVYRKKNMEFIVFETVATAASGEVVLISKILLLQRG